MRFTALIPHALLPGPMLAAVGGALPQTQANKLLATATIVEELALDAPSSGALHWLWRAFGGEAAPVTAPYLWAALTGQPPAAQLWQVELAYFVLARDHVLIAAPEPAPDADERAALGAEAQAAAAELGAQIFCRPEGWFVQPPRDWALEAIPFEAARGRNAHAVQPGGADAAQWRRLLNEVQLRWHSHPVNEAREARGMLPVNALWPQGGGHWRALPRCPFSALVQPSPLLRGWADAAGLPPAAFLDAFEAARGDTLVVCDELQAAAQSGDHDRWLAQWPALGARLQAMQEAAHGAGATLEIVLCGAQRVRTVRPAAPGPRGWWQRWTRRSDLAPLLAEAER